MAAKVAAMTEAQAYALLRSRAEDAEWDADEIAQVFRAI